MRDHITALKSLCLSSLHVLELHDSTAQREEERKDDVTDTIIPWRGLGHTLRLASSKASETAKGNAPFDCSPFP